MSSRFPIKRKLRPCFSFRYNASQICDWKILAQCDGQIVKQLVQYGGREPQTVVRLQSAPYFRHTLIRDTILKNVQETLLAPYLNCGGNLAFRHDSFNGYGLYYKGSNILPK